MVKSDRKQTPERKSAIMNEKKQSQLSPMESKLRHHYSSNIFHREDYGQSISPKKDFLKM